MKISVLIIAHNEEKYIAKCLESVLQQNKKPDEIVLVAHNCTDRTMEIAAKFPFVKIVEYNGEEGQPYARIVGFNEVSGDVIACIDADAYADKHWLERITTPLYKDADISIVGGRVVMTNNILWKISMLLQFFWRKYTSHKISQFASGANFAVRKSDYEKVGGIEPIIHLHNQMGLYLWAEDFYISQALQQIGKLEIIWNAVVFTQMPKEKSSMEARMDIEHKQSHDNNKIIEYFKNKNSGV